jgi:hypothetical protein
MKQPNGLGLIGTIALATLVDENAACLLLGA